MDFRTRAPLENLMRRAVLLRRVREFFDQRGFTEVQTPVLSKSTVIDRHLDPIQVSMQVAGDDCKTWYLQTSPEQSMKRLLASGMGSIYQVGPVFRGNERGRFHNPEFTMVEWYDVGADFGQGLQLLDELLQEVLGVRSARRVRFGDVFQAATGLELFSIQSEELSRWCVQEGLVENTQWTRDWDDWVNLVFSERVQPKLGLDGPVLVTHFPASQAALARVSDSDPRTAERYEAFYRGIELANGYHELLDADELLGRAQLANQQRVSDGKQALPLQNRLLEAMRFGIPDACGCALGFDRIVMLDCNATSLDEVLAFCADNA
ncbi:MAG: EF-P lysine aminoacylase EpmA [Pirellula sp.]